jgi:hypothetical protein
MLTFESGFCVWVLVNSLIALSLVPLAVKALRPAVGVEDVQPEVNPAALLALCALFVLSPAVTFGLDCGNLGICIAGCLLSAQVAQGTGRPLLAGLALALALIKPSTSLPFLLPLLRTDAWKTWVAIGVLTLGLCFAAVPLGRLQSDLGAELEEMRKEGSEGGQNYYGYVRNNSDSRLGIDHALYRVGLRNHGLITSLQLLVLVTLGAYLAMEFAWLRSLPDAALCALVALYSMIFFYHRIYDTAVLALPITYSMAGATRARGRARRLYAISGLAQLTVIHPVGRVLKVIQENSWGWGGAPSLGA